ncbi:MAG: amphi-Trp domain-containing protein [Halobaculum sp.]
MTEEVLFETETSQTRSEIAESLRTVADKLDAGETLTLSAGSDSVSLDVPERATFEVKAEREGGPSNPELSVEFELEWDEGASDGAESSGLSIE